LEVTLTRLLRQEIFSLGEARLIQSLLPRISYRRSPSKIFGLENAKPETRWIIQQIYQAVSQEAQEISLYVFPQSYVTAKGAVITNAGRMIRDSVIQEINQGIVPPGMTKTAEGHFRTGNSLATLVGTALVLETTFDDNYGHWMVQGATLLMLMSEYIARHRPTLIMGVGGPPRLRDVKAALLHELGHDPRVVEHRPDQVIHVENLLYVTPLHMPPLVQRPETLNALREYLIARAFAGSTLTAPIVTDRRLYLARKTNRGRQIANAVALEALLARYAFELFFAEDHSHDDQIRVFAAAEMVIGVKGAAFTNIMFCAPNTKVIVLTPPEWCDPFIWCIAGQFALNYNEVLGAAEPDGGFVVDLKAVEALVKTRAQEYSVDQPKATPE
jgi:capsular polysaccharide biosynthesis protein